MSLQLLIGNRAGATVLYARKLNVREQGKVDGMLDERVEFEENMETTLLSYD